MKSILVQFDTDPQPSVFDRVVAVDAGVDHLFSYANVTPDNVTALVHGAMFTRGPADLKSTAIFAGGSDARAGEELLRRIQAAFFGPMRVSVMMDSNGCNTTAAAAVASARKHLSLKGAKAIVLGATGPVGLRAAELLALEGAQVQVVSRDLERARIVSQDIQTAVPGSSVAPAVARAPAECESLCSGADVIIAAGAAGVCFLETGALARLGGARVVIDLNAVPPAGILDIGVMDKAVDRAGTKVYGAIGVGGLKMKVHKRAVAALFESSDRVLDTREIYALALETAGIPAG
jgi:methylenetetrahydrofolate/methylenetetrahydromethanopterin dehydrogenase (NADP+)